MASASFKPVFIDDPDAVTAGQAPARAYAAAYMAPFMRGRASDRIANLETRALLMDTGDYLFPVTVNDEEYDNTYVCSLYTACVTYGRDELGKISSKPLAAVLRLLCSFAGVLFKWGRINRVVAVNNWMLSTNLYPAWDGQGIGPMRDALISGFPGHAIMFRSLNSHSNRGLMELFAENGFMLVPSRQVYIFDKALGAYPQRHNSRIDAAVLKKTPYKIEPHEGISEADYPRIVEIYNRLYLEKYSKHNPQFTVACIADWHKNRLLEMTGLRNADGILDGIAGCFGNGLVMTAPLVGYDTAKPKNAHLYRMLIALVMRRADQTGIVLNLSSGASGFKMLRGGVPFVEYSAIYIAHLPLHRRCVWKLTRFLLTYVAIPVLKAFKL